ncbi:MAG TPA: RnfABCDGE type electron transport complex subunit D [Thermoanaerobaculia bacterium]|nr:RnfABCDGE type electron transport complex subunit D [Thermoanaerobaculia bacterium]
MAEKAEKKDLRLGALRRFATAITVLNILGHTVLGFEQALATPVVALLAAYSTEILLEWLESRRLGKTPRFLGPGTAFVDFLLSAHITGLAVAMLLYANDQLLPVAFAAVVAIASKHLFRVGTNGSRRHFFNPSNLGITATLLAFPWVGIAQPYMFTENLSGGWDWLLPAVIVCSGSFLNGKFTRKLPLIGAWLGGFVLQAVVRHFLFGNLLPASLNPMTGVAFLLFTFYMVTDPATTPNTLRGQLAFGAAMAAAYGTLMSFHVVFGLFFGLTLVCAGRGALLYLKALAAQRAEAQSQSRVPGLAAEA